MPRSRSCVPMAPPPPSRCNIQWFPARRQPAVNYNPVNGTLTFGIGETNKIINVPLVENNLVQGTVSMSVVLSNPTPGASCLPRQSPR